MGIYIVRTPGPTWAYISLMTIFTIFAKVSEGIVLESFDLRYVLDGLQEMNTSSMCKTHLDEYVNGLVSNKKWAFKMYDSSANKVHGLFEGQSYFINGYDECLSDENRPKNFEAQYCVLKFDFHLGKYGPGETFDPFKFKITPTEFYTVNYGICLPSTCNASEIQTALKDWLNVTSDGEPNYVALSEESCSTRAPIELKNTDWITIGVLAFIGVIAILSTLYDVNHQFSIKKGKPHPLLASFSLYTNTKIFLSITDSKIKAIDGLRTLTSFWVVLGHSYLFLFNGPVENPIKITVIDYDIRYAILYNAYLAVDTFLFISGLLAAHSFFKSITEKGYFDVVRSYIHRFLQLTPSFALVLLIQGTIFSYFGDGPLWYQARNMYRYSCSHDWWSLLSYVQNYFYSPMSMCMQHCWYLSTDMQLYWLSPVYLFPLVFWPKLAPFLLMVEILLFCFTSLTTSIVYNLEAPWSITPVRFATEYSPFYTRGAPWLIGLTLGYIFYRIKEKKISIKLSKVMVAAGWFISAGLCLGSLYSIYYFFGRKPCSVVESAIYTSFHRVAWGAGLAWIVFACQHGYGGIVNKILSWKVFQPFAKLSYAMYLVHYLVLEFRAASSKHSYGVDPNEIVYFFFSNLVIVILISVPILLLVDIPFAIIDRCIFHNVKISPFPAPPSLRTPEKNEHTIENGKSINGFKNHVAENIEVQKFRQIDDGNNIKKSNNEQYKIK